VITSADTIVIITIAIITIAIIAIAIITIAIITIAIIIISPGPNAHINTNNWLEAGSKFRWKI
jgi:hypothetical protein